MMTTQTLTKRNVAAIGEEITHELGAQMIKDYHKAHPNDVKAYVIGKDIINQILAQPGCTGIQFHNAINEKGEKTLVYIGLDINGAPMISYKSVDIEGNFTQQAGIVADKVVLPSDAEECWWWLFL
jgi:hypothetical protein